MMTILSHEFHDDTLTHEFHDGNPSYIMISMMTLLSVNLMISMMTLLSVNSWDPMITLSPHEFHAGTLNLWVQWWHSNSWVPWWQSYLTISMMTLLSFNSWDPIITLSPLTSVSDPGIFSRIQISLFFLSPDPDQPKIQIRIDQKSGSDPEKNVLKLELK